VPSRAIAECQQPAARRLGVVLDQICAVPPVPIAAHFGRPFAERGHAEEVVILLAPQALLPAEKGLAPPRHHHHRCVCALVLTEPDSCVDTRIATADD
jgi:hypothetical protein